MTFKDFEEMFPGFEGKLFLYISGSQGITPNSMIVTYEKDFTDLDSLAKVFYDFIDDNAMENIEDYLEDCDGDEEDALMEAVLDSGEFYVGIEELNMPYEFTGGVFEKREGV